MSDLPPEVPKEGDYIPKSEPLSEAEIAANEIERKDGLEKELDKLSPEEKEKVSLGLTGLGFQAEKLKNKGFAFVFKSLLKPEENKTAALVPEEKAKEIDSLLSEEEKNSRNRLNKTQEKVGFIDRKSGVGRFFSSLSDIFDRDAEMAEKNLNDLREKKEKGENISTSGKGLLSMGVLAGNIIKYGRGIFDAGNAVRPVMFMAMAGATFSEAAKEARASGEDFSKIKDIDKAHEEALRVQLLANLAKSEERNPTGGEDLTKKLSESEYIENVYVGEAWDEALKIQEAAKNRTNGLDKNGNPTKEALEQAYKETVPQDILNRLVKGAEGRTLVEKAFAWRLESVAKYLDTELKAVDANEGLDKGAKEKAKEKLLTGFLRSPLIKDFDRAISQAGEIDSVFLTLSATQDVSKVAVYAMMTDTVAKVGVHLWENVASIMGSSSEFTDAVVAKAAAATVVGQEAKAVPITPVTSESVAPVAGFQSEVRASDMKIAEDAKNISQASQSQVRMSDIKIAEEVKDTLSASQHDVRVSDMKIAEGQNEPTVSVSASQSEVRASDLDIEKNKVPPVVGFQSEVRASDMKIAEEISEEAKNISQASQNQVRMSDIKIAEAQSVSSEDVKDFSGWTSEEPEPEPKAEENIAEGEDKQTSTVTETSDTTKNFNIESEKAEVVGVTPFPEALATSDGYQLPSEQPATPKVSSDTIPMATSSLGSTSNLNPSPVTVPYSTLGETQTGESSPFNIVNKPVGPAVVPPNTPTSSVLEAVQTPLNTETITSSPKIPTVEASSGNVSEAPKIESVVAEQAPAPVTDATPVEVKAETTPTPKPEATPVVAENGTQLTEQQLKLAHQMYDGIVKETTAGSGFFGYFNKGGESSASWQALVKEDVNSLFSKINRDNAGIHVLSMGSNSSYSAEQETKLAKSLFEFVDKGVKPMEGEKVGDFLNRAIAETVQESGSSSVVTNLAETVTPASVGQAPVVDTQPVEKIIPQEVTPTPVATVEATVGNVSEAPKAEQVIAEQAPAPVSDATQIKVEATPEAKVETSVSQTGMSATQFSERLNLNLGSAVLDGDARNYLLKNFDSVSDDEILKIKSMLLGNINESGNEDMKKLFEGKSADNLIIRPDISGSKIEMLLPTYANEGFKGVYINSDGSTEFIPGNPLSVSEPITQATPETVPEPKAEVVTPSQQSTPAYIPEPVENMKDKLRVDSSLLSSDTNKVEVPKVETATPSPVQASEVVAAQTPTPTPTPTPVENTSGISNVELSKLSLDDLNQRITPDVLPKVEAEKLRMTSLLNGGGWFSATKGVDTEIWKTLSNKPVESLFAQSNPDIRKVMVDSGKLDSKYLQDPVSFLKEVLGVKETEITNGTRYKMFQNALVDNAKRIPYVSGESVANYVERVSRIQALRK